MKYLNIVFKIKIRNRKKYKKEKQYYKKKNILQKTR